MHSLSRSRKNWKIALRELKEFDRKFGEEAPDWDYIIPILDVAGNYTLEETDAISRLKMAFLSRRQLGFHFGAGLPSDSTNRLAHAILALHYASDLAKSAGLNDEEIRHLRMAALLHDYGHPVFSHVVDKVLEKRFGYNHEDFLVKELREGDFGKLLSKRGFDVDKLAKLVRGDDLGVVLTEFADRMSYMAFDAQRIFKPGGKLSKKFLNVIKKMRSNLALKNGRLVVKNADVAKQFFKLRFKLIDEGYNSVAFLLNEASLAKAVDKALEKKLVSEDELRRGEENTVYNKIDEDPQLHRVLDLGVGRFTHRGREFKLFNEPYYEGGLNQFSKAVERSENVSIATLRQLSKKGKTAFFNGVLKNALEAALRKNMPDHEFIVAQSAFSKPASFYDEFGRRVVIKPRKGKGVLVLSSLNPAAKQVFGNVLKPFLKSGAKTKLKWSSEAL